MKLSILLRTTEYRGDHTAEVVVAQALYHATPTCRPAATDGSLSPDWCGVHNRRVWDCIRATTISETVESLATRLLTKSYGVGMTTDIRATDWIEIRAIVEAPEVSHV